MGQYLNPDNKGFEIAIASEIYVDKTELILAMNKVLDTEQRFVCVSRPRRFGKSITANMLAAYYSSSCDSKEMFKCFKASQSQEFEKYLNKYIVLKLNMQEFLSRTKSMDEMIDRINKIVIRDIKREYPDIDFFDENDLIESMADVYEETKSAFVVIIDEWDCVFREYKNDKCAQEQYLDFLRDLLKDKVYISLAYMTGILPIKKYGTHSALNMFNEFSMLEPGPLAEFVGFTEDEVQVLCKQYGMNIKEMQSWYDGYHFANDVSAYNPKSVVSSLELKRYGNYWNRTETFEALRDYIDMNFEGLKDDVLSMMVGEKVPVNVESFANDMVTFYHKDDVFTLLIHLGYLGYDYDSGTAFIPNNEVRTEYVNSVSVSDWGEVSVALKKSAETLRAIWDKRPDVVVKGIEKAHFETSYLQYNDENALSYTISLALYAARNFYTVVRELPSGKGFADMVFIPKCKHLDKPALVVELKWDRTAKGAISQILEKQYCDSLKDYTGEILLVGINYDKKTKVHECEITVM